MGLLAALSLVVAEIVGNLSGSQAAAFRHLIAARDFAFVAPFHAPVSGPEITLNWADHQPRVAADKSRLRSRRPDDGLPMMSRSIRSQSIEGPAAPFRTLIAAMDSHICRATSDVAFRSLIAAKGPLSLTPFSPAVGCGGGWGSQWARFSAIMVRNEDLYGGFCDWRSMVRDIRGIQAKSRSIRRRQR